MKLAISNIAWDSSENKEIIPILKKYNTVGIEIAPTKLFENPLRESDESIESVKRYWLDNGITICAMQSLLFGHPELTIFENEDARNATLDYLRQMIIFGSKLGAKVLIFGSPKNRIVGDLDRTKAMEIAIDFFTKLGDIANEYNLKFCIEPNAKDYGCDFVTNITEAVDLVKKVNNPGFGLHVDAGVMTMNGENYEEVLDLAFPYMEHFHISEPFLNHICDSKTDHRRLGRYLKSRGYDKWVSIEMKSGLKDTNIIGVDEALKCSVENYLQN
jgi:D-psicose/D-tagatose/L-ribulose 3-epimerase